MYETLLFNLCSLYCIAVRLYLISQEDFFFCKGKGLSQAFSELGKKRIPCDKFQTYYKGDRGLKFYVYP